MRQITLVNGTSSRGGNPSALALVLQKNQREVLDEWRVLLAREEGTILGIDALSSEMSHVVDAVLTDLVQATTRPTLPAGSVYASASYGATRREQNVAVDLMFREFHLLRRAAGNVLAVNAPTDDHRQVLAQLDHVLAVAGLAASRGWYRDELEAMGRWPQALDDLLREEGDKPSWPEQPPPDRTGPR